MLLPVSEQASRRKARRGHRTDRKGIDGCQDAEASEPQNDKESACTRSKVIEAKVWIYLYTEE